MTLDKGTEVGAAPDEPLARPCRAVTKLLQLGADASIAHVSCDCAMTQASVLSHMSTCSTTLLQNADD